MMLDGTFDVELTDDAEKHYNMLDANMTRRVSRAINLLAQNPLFGPNITKLRGEYAGQYRYASEVTGFSIVWILNGGDVSSQAFTDVVEHIAPDLAAETDNADFSIHVIRVIRANP